MPSPYYSGNYSSTRYKYTVFQLYSTPAQGTLGGKVERAVRTYRTQVQQVWYESLSCLLLDYSRLDFVLVDSCLLARSLLLL